MVDVAGFLEIMSLECEARIGSGCKVARRRGPEPRRKSHTRMPLEGEGSRRIGSCSLSHHAGDGMRIRIRPGRSACRGYPHTRTEWRFRSRIPAAYRSVRDPWMPSIRPSSGTGTVSLHEWSHNITLRSTPIGGIMVRPYPPEPSGVSRYGVMRTGDRAYASTQGRQKGF